MYIDLNNDRLKNDQSIIVDFFFDSTHFLIFYWQRIFIYNYCYFIRQSLSETLGLGLSVANEMPSNNP